MWVYQEPVSSKTLAVPQAAPAPADAARPDPAPFVPFVKEKAGASSVPPAPAPVRRAALRRARGRRQDLARECAILAASYLFGALLSGVALALGSGDEQAFLSAYLDNWSRLFTLDEPGAVWTLFGAEYLTAAGSATLLLLLGLSAFGPVMIHLFAMLFGMVMPCWGWSCPERPLRRRWPGFACLGRRPFRSAAGCSGPRLAGRSSRPWPGPGGCWRSTWC